MVTHYFHPSKESKRVRSGSSKQRLLTKRPPKCREQKENEKRPRSNQKAPKKEQSLNHGPPASQSSPPCSPKHHLRVPRARAFSLGSQSSLSVARAPSTHLAASSPRPWEGPPSPRRSGGTQGTFPPEEGSKRSRSLPPKRAAQGSGLRLVLLPKHSGLCQFGLQHKYCATAGSLVPIMVILQVTMRKIFLIVCGHILLPFICDLGEEKCSRRKFYW